jgi:butyrate kinase
MSKYKPSPIAKQVHSILCNIKAQIAILEFSKQKRFSNRLHGQVSELEQIFKAMPKYVTTDDVLFEKINAIVYQIKNQKPVFEDGGMMTNN